MCFAAIGDIRDSKVVEYRKAFQTELHARLVCSPDGAMRHHPARIIPAEYILVGTLLSAIPSVSCALILISLGAP